MYLCRDCESVLHGRILLSAGRRYLHFTEIVIGFKLVATGCESQSGNEGNKDILDFHIAVLLIS